jgi:hypothetical protein
MLMPLCDAVIYDHLKGDRPQHVGADPLLTHVPGFG